MPSHPVHDALKARVPILFFEQHFSVKQICEILGISKSLAYSVLCKGRLRASRSVPSIPHPKGRPCLLSNSHTNTIQALVDRQHTIYLDKIQDKLAEIHGIYASIPTISRALRRLNFTRKTTSARALERNELNRSIYMNRIAEISPDPDMLMFVDEAARNRRTSARTQGWSRRGARCVQRRFFVRGQRYSILPILTLDGIITYDIIHGSVTSARFLRFLREFVIPLTNPYPGPRSVLVLDNCAIHHSEDIRALVEDEALCKLVFLPPYSPDLNPIEQAFSAIKAFLRRHWNDQSLYLMDQACQSITPKKAWGFFRASGYVV